MIKNTVYNNINDILKKCGNLVTLVIRFDNNIMEKINYDEIFDHMKEKYGIIKSDLPENDRILMDTNFNTLTKEEINQILLKLIRGHHIDYTNVVNFGVISILFEHNITHYFSSKWADIKFVGKNKLKENSEIQYELEGIDFKMVNAPLKVDVEQLSEEDSFWD